eukprot:TRINITY_DN49955_c0_g1_i1.p1 TRINITY_DN49955_c0_g1~~TRINITY_DN49955_c0_g1_i1.p1  ORF type:complete len:387 (+),score=125.66 TRINITY_DN49955_c0_g1_i1:76-1161(+)
MGKKRGGRAAGKQAAVPPPAEQPEPDAGFDADNPYKIPEFKKEESRPCLVEESKFATLFPKYLENYLQTVWKDVVQVLKHHEIEGKLNLVEGSMTVATTRRTWDPYAIIKARDFIKLLSRSVPLHQAQKIFQDDITYEIVKIGSHCRNKERFVKRRQRLIGPNAQTLKALELLTDCYVLVQGNTVAIMGSWKGCKAVRSIVVDCMRNIHPIYGIKQLLIKRELAKNPEMKHEDWSRFIPQFRKTHQKKRKRDPTKWKEKKPYSAFPPDPIPRKEDILMETGEYWRVKEEKDRQKRQSKLAKRAAEGGETGKRAADEAPADAAPAAKKRRKEKRSGGGGDDHGPAAEGHGGTGKKRRREAGE